MPLPAGHDDEADARSDGPRALAGFGSAKGSNEEAYLFQKLVRTGFGTNNVDHCTRLCHASSVAALLEGVGSAAVTGSVVLAVGGVPSLLFGPWGGSVADMTDMQPDTLALRALNTKIHADERVDKTLPSIGDGLMPARRR